MTGQFTRDPLSELLDEGARALLARAYARPGQWAGTVLADPAMAHIRYANSRGIYPLAKDDLPGGEAKTRWGRAFVRALYYQHKWYSGLGQQGWRTSRRTTPRAAGGLVVEVGRVRPAVGVIPRGRAVRVKLERGGQAKAAAVAAKPDSQMWADQGPRWADPERRDW
jgi:hypothetical protein